jgi:hypothetical protein
MVESGFVEEEVVLRDSGCELESVEAASVSVSLPEEDSSSSQDSATGADLGLARVLAGDLVESVRWERVSATSTVL